MSSKTNNKKMDKQELDDTLATSVMKKIESEDLKMKSKWFFAALSIVLLISTCLTTIAISVVLHTIWNDIDVVRTAQVLEFGSPGRAFVLRNAPWILVIALIAMITTLHHLIGKYEMSYRYRHLAPLMVLVGVIFSGLVLSISGFNEKISNNTLSRFKTIETALDSDYVLGEIRTIGDGYIVINSEEGEHKIKIPQSERIRGKAPGLIKEGQEIKVFGKYKGDEFEAYGVVPPDFRQVIKGLKDVR